MLLLTGCATTSPANTSSGHPEVTLTDINPGCVRTWFLDFFLNQGYTIREATPSRIVAGKIAKNYAAQFPDGTRYGGAPEERTTVHFVPQGIPDSLRVVITTDYVSNQYSAFKKIEPIQESQTVQENFTKIKALDDQCRS